jgi:hypothetical protein
VSECGDGTHTNALSSVEFLRRGARPNLSRRWRDGREKRSQQGLPSVAAPRQVSMELGAVTFLNAFVLGRYQTLQKLRHAVVMRALPVDPVAFRTVLKLFLALTSTRGQPMSNRLFCNSL